jgi:glycosyltransferase involved in cell wall biosynthesis
VQVSIIIRNYNYGRFLRQAVDSALAQTYPGVEVIAVDDGSTDDSAEILRSYGDQIIAVLKPNGGAASAVDAGFEKASGEIIFLLDADDWFDPDTVQTVVEAWTPETVVVHYPLRIMWEDGFIKGQFRPPEEPLHEGDVLPLLLREGTYRFMPTSGNAVHRRIYELLYPTTAWRNRLEPGSIFFDTLSIATAPFFGKLKAVQRPLGTFRRHGSNNWSHPQEWTEWKRLLHKYDSYLSFDRMVRHWADQQGLSVTPHLLTDNDNFVRAALEAAWLYPDQPFEAGHTLRSSIFRAILYLVRNRSKIPHPKWKHRVKVLLRPLFCLEGWRRLLTP